MDLIENQYLKENTTFSKDITMHDLYPIYTKVRKQLKQHLKEYLVFDDNVRFYPNKPKMSDLEILSLSVTSECLGIDSENLLFSKIKKDYSKRFPNLIHRTNYNRRKKQLLPWIDNVITKLSKAMDQQSKNFIIDSIPIPVCKICRAPRSTVCRNDNDKVKASRSFDSTILQYYVGYKLHLIVSSSGVYQYHKLLPANMHDLTPLKELEFTHLSDCVLIGDKAYRSNPLQLKLFEHFKIELSSPYRENQKDFKKYPYERKIIRKRIETCFSQYCDDFNIKRNYAKSFSGINTRISTKIAAMTFKQYWNYLHGNKISRTKHSLAA